MKHYSEDLIQAHYQMSDAINDVKTALKQLSSSQMINEERTVTELPDGNTILYMPCSNIAEGYSIMKVISIFGSNQTADLPVSQAVTLLTELKTGQHVASLSSSYLTRLRTGAMTGIATDLLAPEEAASVGVIGTGGMAYEQLLGVLEVRNIKQIYLYNRTREKAEQFKNRLQSHGISCDIHVVSSPAEAVQQADIINCATKSQEAVFNHSDIKPNVHINGLGSYLPSMREIAIDSIAAADLVVLDDKEGAEHEAGEFIEAVKYGKFNWADAQSLSELLAHPPSRKNNTITIFKSVGAAYYDAAVAIGAYKKLQQ